MREKEIVDKRNIYLDAMVLVLLDLMNAVSQLCCYYGVVIQRLYAFSVNKQINITYFINSHSKQSCNVRLCNVNTLLHRVGRVVPFHSMSTNVVHLTNFILSFFPFVESRKKKKSIFNDRLHFPNHGQKMEGIVDLYSKNKNYV